MPLVIYVHGGGYYQGDRTSAYKLAPMADLLQTGHAFATINYRLSGEFPFEKGVTGEHPAAMRDGATALQDLRLRASQFGYSPDKIVLTGSSAGGGIALWLALHDDLRDLSSPKPRDKQSTKVPCVALSDTQTTLNIAEVIQLLGEDQFQLDEGLPGLYGFTAADYNSDPGYYQTRYAASMHEASPISHLSADDNVKVLLTYGLGYGQANIHSPEFGAYLAQGQPADLAAAYARKSLQGLSISHELKADQKLLKNRTNILEHIVSGCF
jgi:pimeloyl-ACP methyl ester carboxylesterase